MSASFDMHLLICTHGRPTLLERTLESFTRVERPPSFVTMWVVENGSDDGACDVCARYGRHWPLRYVHRAEPGRSKAMQPVIDEVGRGLIVFTDDDVRLSPRFLTAYHEAATEHGAGAVYGGPLSIDYDPPQFTPLPWLREMLPPSAAGWELSDPSAKIERACFLGANYAAFAERIIATGGFNPNLGVGSAGNPVGEEFDIQDRLLATGCRGVYVPEARVWHFVPSERCSPQWLLDRTERIWYTNGLSDDTPHPGARWFGAPRWMWRRLLAMRIQAMLSCCSGEQTRFERNKAYRQYKGFVRGVRQRAAN